MGEMTGIMRENKIEEIQLLVGGIRCTSKSSNYTPIDYKFELSHSSVAIMQVIYAKIDLFPINNHNFSIQFFFLGSHGCFSIHSR